MLESLERRLVFRPVTEQWSRYSPSILNEEDVWIPVGSAGERLHGWWLEAPGAEATLVYFHGARVNLSGSVYRLRAFRAAGYNVLAIDYRGFGRSSERLPSEESVYQDALAAWRWLDAAMHCHAPSKDEEAALWDLLCRARRERYWQVERLTQRTSQALRSDTSQST